LAKEFENQEEWAKAHALYQQLQDFEADARLLIHAGEALSKSGRLSLLAKWLDELPAGIFLSHPVLLARRGMVVATLGNSEFGLSLLDQAMTPLSAESNVLWHRR
jgi:ATP/maltotriose-dependent transcriptional regulator MalT